MDQLEKRFSDVFILWFWWFVYVSSVPVFVLVVIGGILAVHRPPLRQSGIGMVVGAIASPALWTVGASVYQNT